MHDALYASELVPRAIADELFYDLMFYCGVEEIKRKAMYEAVSEFGGEVWEDHTQESIENAREFVSIAV